MTHDKTDPVMVARDLTADAVRILASANHNSTADALALAQGYALVAIAQHLRVVTDHLSDIENRLQDLGEEAGRTR